MDRILNAFPFMLVWSCDFVHASACAVGYTGNTELIHVCPDPFSLFCVEGDGHETNTLVWHFSCRPDTYEACSGLTKKCLPCNDTNLITFQYSTYFLYIQFFHCQPNIVWQTCKDIIDDIAKVQKQGDVRIFYYKPDPSTMYMHLSLSSLRFSTLFCDY